MKQQTKESITMGERALLNRVNKIKELEAEVKELEAIIEGIKDELKQDLTDKKQEEAQAGDYIIRYKEVTSNRFDTTSFKKEHEALYQEYAKTTTSKRFTIN